MRQQRTVPCYQSNARNPASCTNVLLSNNSSRSAAVHLVQDPSNQTLPYHPPPPPRQFSRGITKTVTAWRILNEIRRSNITCGIAQISWSTVDDHYIEIHARHHGKRQSICRVQHIQSSNQFNTPKRMIQGKAFQWASYKIRKIAGCAWGGDAGNVFPTADFKGNR